MCLAISEGGKRCPIHRIDTIYILRLMEKRLQGVKSGKDLKNAFSEERKIALKNNLDGVEVPQTPELMWAELSKLGVFDYTMAEELWFKNKMEYNEVNGAPDAATYLALKNLILESSKTFLQKDRLEKRVGFLGKNMVALVNDIQNEKIKEKTASNQSINPEELFVEASNEAFLRHYRIPKNAIYPKNGSYFNTFAFPYYDTNTDELYLISFREDTLTYSKDTLSSNENKEEILAMLQSDELTSLNDNFFTAYEKIDSLMGNQELKRYVIRCGACGQFTSSNSEEIHICLFNGSSMSEQIHASSLRQEKNLTHLEYLKIGDYINTKNRDVVPFLTDEELEHEAFKASISPDVHLAHLPLLPNTGGIYLKNRLEVLDFDKGATGIRSNYRNIITYTKGDIVSEKNVYRKTLQDLVDSLDEGEYYVSLQESEMHVRAGFISHEKPKITRLDREQYHAVYLTKDYENNPEDTFNEGFALSEESLANKKNYIKVTHPDQLHGNYETKYYLPFKTMMNGFNYFTHPKSHYSEENDNNYLSISGNVIVYLDEKTNVFMIDKAATERTLQCSCEVYKKYYRCEHIDTAIFDCNFVHEREINNQKNPGLRSGQSEQILQYVNSTLDNIQIVDDEKYGRVMMHVLDKDSTDIFHGDGDDSLIYNYKEDPYYSMTNTPDIVLFKNFRENLLNEKFPNGIDPKDESNINETVNAFNTLLAVNSLYTHKNGRRHSRLDFMHNALRYQPESEPLSYIQDIDVLFNKELRNDNDQYQTTGKLLISVDTNHRDQIIVTPKELKCDCPVYAELYYCDHTRTTELIYKQDLKLKEEQPDALTSEFMDYNMEILRPHKQTAEPITLEKSRNFFKELEEYDLFIQRLPNTETLKNAHEKPLTEAGLNALDHYKNIPTQTEDINELLEDKDALWSLYKNVQNNKANHKEYLSFTPNESVTNGIFAPETGLKFGLEIEVVDALVSEAMNQQDFNEMEETHGIIYKTEAEKTESYKQYKDDIFDKNVNMRKKELIKAMKKLEYTNQKDVQAYHSSKNSEERMQQWTIEEDSTVDLEIVSPPLSDSPESWNQINNVTYLLKRYGFKVNHQCGGHINVSTAENITSKDLYHTTKVVTDNIAMFQRLGQDVKAGRHRGTEYCEPIFEDFLDSEIFHSKQEDNEAYDDYVESYDDYTDYNAVKIHNNRLEYRLFDGSLEPSTLQHRLSLVASSMSAGLEHKDTSIDKELFLDLSPDMEDYHTDEERDFRALKQREKRLIDENGKSNRHSLESFTEESVYLKDFISKIAKNKGDVKRLTSLYSATFWESQ